MSETSKILNLELKKCALAPIECSFENVVKYIKTCCTSDASIASRVQMKSWAGKALETYFAFFAHDVFSHSLRSCEKIHV
jgi:hypothetical protein